MSVRRRTGLAFPGAQCEPGLDRLSSARSVYHFGIYTMLYGDEPTMASTCVRIPKIFNFSRWCFDFTKVRHHRPSLAWGGRLSQIEATCHGVLGVLGVLRLIDCYKARQR